MNFSKRVSQLNTCQDNRQGRYVLYWMQMFKRVDDNDALNFAIQQANERDLPLVVYEGLKFYCPGLTIASTPLSSKASRKGAPNLLASAFATFLFAAS